LKVIVKNKLAPSFSAYVESDRETNDEDGQHVLRRVYRWNGHYYHLVPSAAIR